MAHALARARQGRYLAPRLATFFAHATVGPVLIPHSKEVRRKSTIDRKLEVAELLAARGRPFLTAAELSPTSPIRPSIAQFSQGK